MRRREFVGAAALVEGAAAAPVVTRHYLDVLNPHHIAIVEAAEPYFHGSWTAAQHCQWLADSLEAQEIPVEKRRRLPYLREYEGDSRRYPTAEDENGESVRAQGPVWLQRPEMTLDEVRTFVYADYRPLRLWETGGAA